MMKRIDSNIKIVVNSIERFQQQTMVPMIATFIED
jgi:hypothetical protein